MLMSFLVEKIIVLKTHPSLKWSCFPNLSPPSAGWCEVSVHGNVENPTGDVTNVKEHKRSSSHLLLAAVNSLSVDCI